jgi:hypothetical protein
MHTITITTAAGSFTVTYPTSSYFYYSFDNVNKIFSIFDSSAKTNPIAAFTGVVSYSTEAFTVS